MSIFVDIEKTLGDFHLKVKLEAADETLALLGASGCGKSMTLKCVAGVERPDRGRIVVDGVTLFDSEQKINLSPQARRTGLLFQNYALFPNMTVAQNLRSGAMREKDRAVRAERVTHMLDTFGLTDLSHLYPRQLSGGQQQRVALARILVSSPRLLLLDEPFSALDSHLRFKLEQEVRQVIRSFGKTVLLVSHDRDEVFRMADKVAVMDHGSVAVSGPKARVFSAPGTRTAAVLTGCKNISRLELLGPRRGWAADWGVELTLPPHAGVPRFVGIRMHSVRPGGGENTFRCQVTEALENPFSFTLMLRPIDAPETSTPIGWELDKSAWRAIASNEVTISLPPDSLLLLDE